MNEFIFIQQPNGEYQITPVTFEQLWLASGTYFIAGQIVQVMQLEGDMYYIVEPRIADGTYIVDNV